MYGITKIHSYQVEYYESEFLFYSFTNDMILHMSIYTTSLFRGNF